MDTLDLSVPIRDALLAESAITDELPAYLGDYPIFTRRPVPVDAPYPLIVVSEDITVRDDDGIDDRRPIVVRDILVYGRDDTAEHYRAVNTIAYAIRRLFHGNRQSIEPDTWGVIDIRASGPNAAPTDDDQTVGRMVELTIRLAYEHEGA